jgi:opacity protein-like surface antigen
MKRLIVVTLASTCLFTSLNAYGNYTKYSILYSVPSDLEAKPLNGNTTEIEMKSGFSLEAAMGFMLSDNFAFETQYTYDTAKTKSTNVKVDVHSIFLNGIYNIKLDTKGMRPYIGAGIGTSSYSDGSHSDTVFAYQGFLGLGFDIEYNLETFVEYKYKKFNNIFLDTISYENTDINSIGVGIKTKF